LAVDLRTQTTDVTGVIGPARPRSRSVIAGMQCQKHPALPRWRQRASQLPDKRSKTFKSNQRSCSNSLLNQRFGREPAMDRHLKAASIARPALIRPILNCSRSDGRVFEHAKALCDRIQRSQLVVEFDADTPLRFAHFGDRRGGGLIQL